MGTYATTTAISELLPFLMAGNTTTSDTVMTAIFTRHIDRAEGEVNSFIVARYSLPFTTVPPLIRKLTEDIASYYTLRGSYVKDGQLRQEYLDDFLEAKETLQKIHDGTLKLALTNGSLVDALTSTRFLSSSDNYAPTFEMDEPTDWEVDTTRLDDVEADRD